MNFFVFYLISFHLRLIIAVISLNCVVFFVSCDSLPPVTRDIPFGYLLLTENSLFVLYRRHVGLHLDLIRIIYLEII